MALRRRLLLGGTGSSTGPVIDPGSPGSTIYPPPPDDGSGASGWVWYLADSETLTPFREFIGAKSKQLTVGLNRAGSASVALRMDDPAINDLIPGSTCIMCKKHGVTRWSGPIVGWEEDVTSQTVNVRCSGWFDTLKRRYVRDNAFGLDQTAEMFGSTSTSFDTASLIGWYTSLGDVYRNPDDGVAALGCMQMNAAPSEGVQAYAYMIGLDLTQTYQLSFWVKWDDLTTVETDILSVVIDDDIGITPTQNAALDITMTSIDAQTWIQYKMQFSPTASTLRLKFYYLNTNSHVIMIDDIQLFSPSNVFHNEDIGDIALELIDYANQQGKTWVKRGTRQVSWNRTVKFTPFQSIGDEIQRMSDVENGYDFEVDPATRQLNIYYPMKGYLKTEPDPSYEAHVKSGATVLFQLDEDPALTGNVYTDSILGMNLTSIGVIRNAALEAYGPANYAAKFDWVNNSGSLMRNTASDPKFPIGVAGGSFTFSCLVNMATLSADNTLSTIVDEWYVFPSRQHAFRLEYHNGFGAFRFSVGNSLYAYATITTSLIQAGVTYHVCCSYDNPSGTLRIYLNGVQEGSSLTDAAFEFPTSNTPILTLGCGVDTVDGTFHRHLNGVLDEVGLWVGRALSPFEVFQLYRSLRQRSAAALSYPRFGYGDAIGTNNLASVKRRVDMDAMNNWVVAQGKNATSISGVAIAEDVASQDIFGLQEQIAQLSEVTSQDILNAYVNAEVAVAGRPRVSFEIVPRPWNAGGNVPSIFDDYDIGDVLAFDCVSGSINVTDQNIRIFGATITIDENDVERVTLQISAGS